jgi:nucleotide-binding universal stress UspA family protein
MDIEPSSAVSRYRIVVALDGSEYAEIVLEHALDQAARHDAPDLHVIVVIEDEGVELEPIKVWLAACVLDGLESFRAGRPGWRTRLHVRAGKAAEEIANLAAEINADLVVVGRYGLHHARRSVADAVLEMAICPTLVVGLTDHPVETVPQCAECAVVREQSDGERWFCARHSDASRLHLTTLVPAASISLHGGPLW